jgi:hypothetical protein
LQTSLNENLATKPLEWDNFRIMILSRPPKEEARQEGGQEYNRELHGAMVSQKPQRNAEKVKEFRTQSTKRVGNHVHGISVRGG